MSFDPETIQALFHDPNETAYSEDFRKRHGNAPVFDHVAKLQLDFYDAKVPKDGLVEAWNIIQGKLAELEREASEQGLLGEVVTLRGSGIDIPKFETDLSASTSIVSIHDLTSIDEKSIETYYNADEINGNFSGFTLLFEKADNDLHIPRIAYQVSVKVIDVPHMHLNLYATGKVGQSIMRFESDERLDALAPILEKLYSLCGDSFNKVDLINMALAKFDKYDAALLRHVTYHAETLINDIDESVSSAAEDSLIELLEHYLGSANRIHLKTPFFLLSPDEIDGDTEYYEDANGYNVSGKCIGLGFFNRIAIKDGKVTLRKGKALSFVIEHEGRNLITPLAKIEEYSIV